MELLDILDEFGNSKNKITIPVGKISSSETVTVKEKVLYRIIDSYDFSFEENTKEGYWYFERVSCHETISFLFKLSTFIYFFPLCDKIKL